MFEWLYSQLPGLIVGAVLSGLVGLVGFYAKKRIGQREDHQKLLHRVIEEIHYNGGSGMGDVKVPFRHDAHKELSASSHPTISEKIKQLAQESCRVGALCNGGKTTSMGPNIIVPNMIKHELGPQLKDELQKLLKKKKEKVLD